MRVEGWRDEGLLVKDEGKESGLRMDEGRCVRQ